MKKQGLIAGFALAAAMALSPYGISAVSAAGPTVGDKATDGTVYAGVSPDTHKPLYTTAADAPGLYSWDAAQRYCSALTASGHNDWRDPTTVELNLLFQSRAAIGGFNTSGSRPAGWYWSSSHNRDYAQAQNFNGGGQGFGSQNIVTSSLRCVR